MRRPPPFKARNERERAAMIEWMHGELDEWFRDNKGPFLILPPQCFLEWDEEDLIEEFETEKARANSFGFESGGIP